MGEKDPRAFRQHLTQHMIEPNNDSQSCLLQLLSPFIDAALPNKLAEVVHYLRSLSMNLLARRNNNASLDDQLSEDELYDFLETYLPALCLRRRLQGGGSIVPLFIRNLPPLQTSFSQIKGTLGKPERSSSPARDKIHMVLSDTNHLFSWIWKIRHAKPLGLISNSEEPCDVGDISYTTPSLSAEQDPPSNVHLSGACVSPLVMSSLLSDDPEAENAGPSASCHALTKRTNLGREKSVLADTASQWGPKDRCPEDFESKSSTAEVLSGMKAFFSHIPSIFVATEVNEVELCDTHQTSCFSQSPPLTKPEVCQEKEEKGKGEEEEDLFRDLYTVSYGFGQVENVFFNVACGLYVEVDVVRGRCLRVIPFSSVDETISSIEYTLASSFYWFHEQLTLQRQFGEKQFMKGATRITECVHAMRHKCFAPGESIKQISGDIPLFHDLFLGVRTQLEANLQNQFEAFDKADATVYMDANNLDSKKNRDNLSREYREKWSAAKASNAKVDHVEGPDSSPIYPSNRRASARPSRAFTVVLCPSQFLARYKTGLMLKDLSPNTTDIDAESDIFGRASPFDHGLEGGKDAVSAGKFLMLSSMLKVTICERQDAPIQGFYSMCASDYQLVTAESEDLGRESVSSQDHLNMEWYNRMRTRDSLPLGDGKDGLVDGSHSFHESQLSLRDHTPGQAVVEAEMSDRGCAATRSGCPIRKPHGEFSSRATNELCWLAFSGRTEIWLFYDSESCAGAGNTNADFALSSSELGTYAGWPNCNQQQEAAFSPIPGGMHSRWVVDCPPKTLPTTGGDASTVTEAVTAEITRHESRVCDSIVRSCNKILGLNQLSGPCCVHGTVNNRGSWITLSSQQVTSPTSKKYFDPLSYDETLLSGPFSLSREEEPSW